LSRSTRNAALIEAGSKLRRRNFPGAEALTPRRREALERMRRLQQGGRGALSASRRAPSRCRVMEKLGARNGADLARIAVRACVFQPGIKASGEAFPYERRDHWDRAPRGRRRVRVGGRAGGLRRGRGAHARAPGRVRAVRATATRPSGGPCYWFLIATRAEHPLKPKQRV
jgi:hypothetical protein